MSAAAPTIRPRQMWRNESTGGLVKVISHLEKQDEVVLMSLLTGSTGKMNAAAFRSQHHYVLSQGLAPAAPTRPVRPKTPRKGPSRPRKAAAPKGSPEKDLVASILARLEMMPGVFAWRNNTGAFKAEATKTTRRKFVRFGALGSGDVFVVVAPHGRFLSVEAKAPKGRERDSQKLWRQKMRHVGAGSIVVRSVDEVVAAIVAIQNNEM